MERDDVVVQLPAWSPPAPSPRQRQHQRARSFPRRWNASGGLRRAAGRISATSRLLGRRSVPTTRWDGRRALEQALLLAAAVPLRASTTSATSTTTTVDTTTDESEPRGLDSTTDPSVHVTEQPGPVLDTDNEHQLLSDSAQNSFDNDSVLSPYPGESTKLN